MKISLYDTKVMEIFQISAFFSEKNENEIIFLLFVPEITSIL